MKGQHDKKGNLSNSLVQKGNISIESKTGIIANQLLDENGGQMDAKEFNRQMSLRIFMIKKEIHSKNLLEEKLDYCPQCLIKLRDKMKKTKAIHNIIFHFSHYQNQNHYPKTI